MDGSTVAVDVRDGVAVLAANVAVGVNSEFLTATWQAMMKSDRDIARVVENLAKVSGWMRMDC